jgi:hypothetical protein
MEMQFAETKVRHAPEDRIIWIGNVLFTEQSVEFALLPLLQHYVKQPHDMHKCVICTPPGDVAWPDIDIEGL